MKRYLILFMIVILWPISAFSNAFTTKSFDLMEENKNLTISDFNTKHFRVVIDNRNPEIINYVKETLEKSYDSLEKSFKFKIKQRIRVVIDTKYDNYSGYTDILERRIYLSLGVPMEFESYGKSFIRSLIQHELTHYFVAQIIETIPLGIGRSISWMIIPMWFHEGVSEYFSATWDTFNDILTRTAFLNGRVSRNSMLTFYYSDTLGRRMGYNLGFSFIRYISQKYGEDIIFKILRKVRKFKIDFKRILKVCGNNSCNDLFNEWNIEEKLKYEKIIEGKKDASYYGELINSGNKISINPIFSNDGNGLYYSSNRDSDYMKFSIYYMNLVNKKVKRIIKNVHHRFAISPDMKEIIYSKENIYNNGEVVSDLYKYNQKSRRTLRLTRFMLAGNPSISSDGKKIVFTSGKNCRQDVWIMDIDGNNKKKLTNFAIGEAAYSPSFVKKGNQIIFSFRSEDGKSYIGKLSGKDYKKFEIFGDKKHIFLRPSQSKFKDGSIDFLLGDAHFLNMATMDKNGKIYKFTDIKTGIIDFNFSKVNKKIAFTEVSDNGIRILVGDDSTLIRENCKLDTRFISSHFNRPDDSKIKMPHLLQMYNGMPEFQYLIPWLDFSGNNPLIGFKTKLSDPLHDNELEITAVGGKNSYKKNILTFTMKGMNPIFGVNLYDISDEFRPSQNRTYRGIDFYSTVRINPCTYISGIAYRRKITSNSISPVYYLRHGRDVNEKDAGVTGKFIYYKVERTINQDIHPVNSSAIIAENTRTSKNMRSFYNYKMTRINLLRSFIINRRRDQITLKYQYGHSSGDYEFQFGGIGEIRGYKTNPFVGQRINATSLELNLNNIKYSFINSYLSITKIYPTLFFDRGSAYYNNSTYHNSYGLELSSRILIFNKISFNAKYGVALRGDDHETEFYGSLIMKF